MVDRIGIDEFRKMVEEELTQPWAQHPIDPTPLLYPDDEEVDAPQPLAPGSYASPNGDRSEFELWRVTNVEPQKQAGYHVVLIKLPIGDIQDYQFPLLANIARQFAGGRRGSLSSRTSPSDGCVRRRCTKCGRSFRLRGWPTWR